MDVQMTRRQQEVLDFMREFTDRNGVPPTVREIGARFRVTPRAAFDHLRALERKGLVSMPRNPPQRTGGRYFPEYWATLTDEGKAYCMKHYQKIGEQATA